MMVDQNSGLAEPAWRNSNSVCALADGERHLGHILKIGGRWLAYDATHFNEESNGFRSLGTFASQSAAKEAVVLCGTPALQFYAGAA